MRLIDQTPITMTATSEDQARELMDRLIAGDVDDYSLTYDEDNGIFKLYDDTLDGICVMIVTVKRD